MVSVIIPARNRLPYLRRVLQALQRQQDPPPWEAVVVDDGSTDGTGQWAKAAGLRVVIHDQAAGRAQARNAGAAAARGDVLLFLDADMLAVPRILRTHARLHAVGHGVVSGSPWCWREVPLAAPLDALDAWARPGPIPAGQVRLATGPAPWLHFVTRAVSVAARGFPGFDPGFRAYGFEDWELGYRLAQAGASFVLASDGAAYHQQHPTTDRSMADVRRSYGTFLEAHPDLDVALMAAVPPWSRPGEYGRLLASVRRLPPSAAAELGAAALAAARRWVREAVPVLAGAPVGRPSDPVFDPAAREAVWWLQRLGRA